MIFIDKTEKENTENKENEENKINKINCENLSNINSGLHEDVTIEKKETINVNKFENKNKE